MKNLEEQPRAGKEEGNKIPCVLTHSRIPQPASVLPRPPDTGHKVPTARNSARRVRTSRMELQVNGTADEPARLTRCCFQVEQTRMRKMSVYKRKNRLLIPVCLISTLAQRFRREENRFTTFVCSAPVFLKSFITKAKPHCPVSLQRGAQSPAACRLPSAQAGRSPARLGRRPSLLVVFHFQHHIVTRAHLILIEEEFQSITTTSSLG